MFRKMIGVAFAMTVVIGFVAADEFGAIVSKVDGNKVTYFKTKKGKKDGDAITAEVAKDVKVAKGKFDKADKKWSAGDAIEGGLKAKVFAELDAEKGVGVRLTIADDGDAKGKITQILTTKKGK